MNGAEKHRALYGAISDLQFPLFLQFVVIMLVIIMEILVIIIKMCRINNSNKYDEGEKVCKIKKKKKSLPLYYVSQNSASSFFLFPLVHNYLKKIVFILAFPAPYY